MKYYNVITVLTITDISWALYDLYRVNVLTMIYLRSLTMTLRLESVVTCCAVSQSGGS